MYGRTYVCMYICTFVRTVDDVMAIKPNFLASMAYQYFLSYGAPRVCAFGAHGAPLLCTVFVDIVSFFLSFSCSVRSNTD